MRARGWWEDKLKGNSVAGIELRLSGSSLMICYVVLHRKGSKLEIKEKGEATSVNELRLPNSTPVALSISGKGIIHKKVAYSEGMDAGTLLQKVLPNAKPADFYVQRTADVNGSVIVSVARRNSIDELLTEFMNSRSDVVSCTLGPFCISSIITAISGTNETLRLPGHTIDFAEDVIEQYTSEENSVVDKAAIGDEPVDAALVVPFAAGASCFTGSDLVMDIPVVAASADEFRQGKIFRLAGAGLLIVLFTTLLSNYFLFDHYWKKKQGMEMRSSANMGAVEEYTKLKEEYDRKMQFLQGTGLLDRSQASFYADRIAMDIPEVIQLSEMNISPRERTESENDMQFESRVIRVTGSCRKSNELNEWIKLLGKKEWVRHVELINYKQGKADPSGEFIINIKIK
jgi:Tfp pilus assembly protein PilN